MLLLEADGGTHGTIDALLLVPVKEVAPILLGELGVQTDTLRVHERGLVAEAQLLPHSRLVDALGLSA